MRSILVSLVLAFVMLAACAGNPPRIDSSSDQAFDATFAKMVESLHGYDRRKLALGLFGELLPAQCLSADATIHLIFFPVAPGDAGLFRSCRSRLDGKTYEEILKEGEPKHDAPAPST
jgi:hypothetical protein